MPFTASSFFEAVGEHLTWPAKADDLSQRVHGTPSHGTLSFLTDSGDTRDLLFNYSYLLLDYSYQLLNTLNYS